MLHASRHDEHLTGLQRDVPVAQMDGHLPVEHDEDLVGFGVGMPDELPLDPHQLEVIVVHLGDDPRRPALTEAAELRGKIDRSVRHGLSCSPRVSARSSTRQTLPEKEILVAAREVVDGAQNLEAALGVKGRGLKRERREHDLPAPSAPRFPLGRVEQPRPEPLPPPRFFHPELTDLASAAPRVAADPGNDPAALVLHEDRQPLTIPHARRAPIELVETVLQVPDLRGRRMRLEEELGSHAGLTRLYMTASEGPVGNRTRLRSTPSRTAPTFSATR